MATDAPAAGGAAPGPTQEGSESEEHESGWDRTKANARTVVGAVVLAVFIRVVLFEAFEIEGPSMEPTLYNGDRVVVAKYAFGLFLPFTHEAVVNWGTPHRGDVVIVNSPHDGVDIVKRVIALPGDRVEVRDDVVYLNGSPIPRQELGPCTDHDLRMHDRDDPGAGCEWVQEQVGEHTYRTSHDPGVAPFDGGPTTVPPGHVYILGDHRDRSNDSRFFGPVPVNRIKGRALFVYYSADAHGVRGPRIFRSIE
jgi:signal peptidase I